MTEPFPESEEHEGAEAEQAAPQGEINPQRGKRRRRKLQRWLDDEDDLLSGTTNLMAATEPTAFEHRVVFDGEGLTRRGGPAREVLALVERLVDAVQSLVPYAEPGLASLAGGNSIEITLYASDREVAEAITRRGAATGGEEPEVDDEDERWLEEPTDVAVDAGDDEVEIDADALPDTTLAVVVLTEILRYDDPEDAAHALRRISAGAADSVCDLALTLADRDVKLIVDTEKERVEAPSDWSLNVVEYLDASSEEPSARGAGHWRAARGAGPWPRGVRDRDRSEYPIRPAGGKPGEGRPCRQGRTHPARHPRYQAAQPLERPRDR